MKLDICASVPLTVHVTEWRPDPINFLLVAADRRSRKVVGQRAFEGDLTPETLVALIEDVAVRHGMPSVVCFDNALSFVRAAKGASLDKLGIECRFLAVPTSFDLALRRYPCRG